jgi:hypothetical protein
MGCMVCATCKKCWSDCQADLWCPECHPRCERWGSRLFLLLAAIHGLVFCWGLWTSNWWSCVVVSLSWVGVGLCVWTFNSRMKWNLPRSEWPHLQPSSLDTPSAPS